MKNRVLRTALPYLVLIFICITLFNPVFLKGYVLDGNHDRRDQIVPFQIMHMRAFQNWEIPQWNPYIFNGLSMHGSAVYPLYYPFYWPAYLFPEKYLSMSLTLTLIIHVFFAGIFMFQFLRKIAGGFFWPVCGMVIYLLSSTSILQMTTGLNFNGFVYLPLLFYLIASRKESNPWLNAVAQTAALVLLFLGTNLQISIYVAGLYFLFAMFQAMEPSDSGAVRINRKFVLLTIGAVVMAGMICAIRLFPFYFAIKSFGNIVTSYTEFKMTGLTHEALLVRFFTPEFFGDKLKLHGVINYFEGFSCYIGIIAGFMGLYSLFFIWNKKNIFWNVIIILILLTLLGTPFTFLHYHMTGRSLLLYNRLAWLLPFCFAVLFVLNADIILRKKRKSLALFSSVTFFLVLYVLMAIYRSDFYPEAAKIANSSLIQLSVLYFAGMYIVMLGMLYLSGKNTSIDSGLYKVLLFMALCADLSMIARIESNASNDFLSPMPFFRYSDSEAIIVNDPLIAGRMNRVLVWSSSTNTMLPNNKFIALDAYNSSGYDNNVPSLISKLYNYPHKGNRLRNRVVTPSKKVLLQLTSTKIIFDDNHLYSVNDSLPRVGLFDKYIVLSSEPEILKTLLHDADFDRLNTVILDKKPDIIIEDTQDPGKVTIVKDTNNIIELDVLAKSNSILLLNDTYAEGWSVFLDGKPVRLMRGNFAFRAVEIQEGRHQVRFHFVGKGFYTGAAITIISLLMFFILIWLKIIGKITPKGIPA